MAHSERLAWEHVQQKARFALDALNPRSVEGRALQSILGTADTMLGQLAHGVHENPRRMRSNPMLAVWGNPGRTVSVQLDQELSQRAIALSYTHVDDDEDYEHPFAKGVTVYTALIGDRATTRTMVRGVLLYRPDGRNLWDDFEVSR